MKNLLKAYKTEIKPTQEQKIKIEQGIGVCRYLYNSYVAKNIEFYNEFKEEKIDKKNSFVSANSFDKYINNEIKVLEDFSWINTCGSKARKKAICDAETSFKRFFKGLGGFPRFKKKKNQDVKLYFPKNNKTDWKIDRHRLNIPTLKWVRLKEFGYIPTNGVVKSGTISKKAGRYFVSVLIEVKEIIKDKPYSCGIGIDLGIKDTLIASNTMKFKNINKTSNVKRLERKLKKEQRTLSRKYESLKLRKNKEKGEATRQNIQKQIAKVQRYHQRLTNIRKDYNNKIVAELVKIKPVFITIEDLSISNMMKNRHLSKAIAQQKLYDLTTKLVSKANQNGIEVRKVSRWFPSSKLCNNCGSVKSDLKLSDRIYKCSCGYVCDRDLQASYNLRDCKEYKII
ncbi:MAG: RNA-guided endonuclease InsQ/TnpB family protein [Sarcina sp.]